jgi:hypothetical protein
MARIKFKKMSQANYGDALFTPDINTLYFVEDTGSKFSLYVGSNLIYHWLALDENGKFSSSLMPSIAITDTYVTSTEELMLALNVQKGDIAIRTDINKSYIYNGPGLVGGVTIITDWIQLSIGGNVVTTVNGSTGIVVLTGADINVSGSDTRKISNALVNISNNIINLSNQIDSLITGVSSVNHLGGDVEISGNTIAVSGLANVKYWDSAIITDYENASVKFEGAVLPKASSFAQGNAYRIGKTYRQQDTEAPYTNNPWTNLDLNQANAYAETFGQVTQIFTDEDTGYNNQNDVKFSLNLLKAPNDFPLGVVVKVDVIESGVLPYNVLATFYFRASPLEYNYFIIEVAQEVDTRTVAFAIQEAEGRIQVLEESLEWTSD